MCTSDKKNKLVDTEKIKNILDARGVSYAQFGRKLGISHRESISRRLQNDYTITADELILMAAELGVPVEELSVTE